ncbi:MAG TPA: hypothetical protein VNN25_05505 [Thermoanaerobaculia bacterium]|nr:hypothetical protein [Thermoanaerobaculia bacterium]
MSRMLMMSRLSMALSLLFAATWAMAIQPLKHERTFHIRQFDRSFVVCGLRCPDNKENLVGGRLAPEMSFEMDPGESVEVWIDDPNPLLFTYKFGGITVVKNSDVVALEAIATELSKVGGALQLKAGPSAKILASSRVWSDIDRKTQATSELERKITRLSAAIKELARLQKEDVPTEIALSADPANWKKVRDNVESWDLSSLSQDVTDGYAAIDNAVEPLDLTASTTPEILQALSNRSKVDALLKGLKDFADTVETIGVPIAITNTNGSPVFIEFDTLNDQRFVVSIASLTGAQGFSQAAGDKLTAEHIPLKEDLTIIAIPHHNVHLRTAVAAVYNFVRRPTFDANKSGDDLVIRRKDADRWTGQNVGLMLHIVPANWDQQFLSGEFQFGITPIADQFAAYLGGGVVFNKYFSLATGIVAQRVDRLATGLHVGDVVASADDVKTVKRFQMGAYICLTVDFKMPTGK